MITYMLYGDVEIRGVVDVEPMYVIDNSKENELFRSNGFRIVTDLITFENLMSFTDYLVNQDGYGDGVISLSLTEVESVNTLNESVIRFIISQWFYKEYEFITTSDDSKVHLQEFCIFIGNTYKEILKTKFGLKDEMFIASLIQDYKEYLIDNLSVRLNGNGVASYNFRNVTNLVCVPNEEETKIENTYSKNLLEELRVGSEDLVLYYLDDVDYIARDNSTYHIVRVKIKKVIR